MGLSRGERAWSMCTTWGEPDANSALASEAELRSCHGQRRRCVALDGQVSAATESPEPRPVRISHLILHPPGVIDSNEGVCLGGASLVCVVRPCKQRYCSVQKLVPRRWTPHWASRPRPQTAGSGPDRGSSSEKVPVLKNLSLLADTGCPKFWWEDISGSVNSTSPLPNIGRKLLQAESRQLSASTTQNRNRPNMSCGLNRPGPYLEV